MRWASRGIIPFEESKQIRSAEFFPKQENTQIRLVELFRSSKVRADDIRNHSVLRNCFWSANGIIPIAKNTLVRSAEFFYEDKLNKIET